MNKVDLLIESNFDLALLTDFLKGNVFFLYNEKMDDGRYLIGVESNKHDFIDAEEDLVELLNLVEILPNDIKVLWDSSSK